MGVKTRKEIREEVMFDLMNRTDTGEDSGSSRGVNTTRVNGWINDTLRHVSHPSVHKHREMQYRYTITLVADTNSYTFSPDPAASTVTITAIRFGSYVQAASDDFTATRRKLLPESDQWFQERTHTTGPPSLYAVEGNSVLVSPVPSASAAGNVLSFSAFREHPLLGTDDDAVTTSIGAIWDEVVILGARWRAELHLGQLELASVTQRAYGALINEYQSHEALHGESDWDWMGTLRQESYMRSA